jgi:2-dehydropantoate 2-reductase
MRGGGLTFESPAERVCVDIPAVGDIADADLEPDTVVLLTVKTQDSAGAMNALRSVAGSETPVVCVQNGVESERIVARQFSNVYGIPVMCPCLHLEPGVVRAYSAPVTGILDLGRYPAGSDATASAISAAFNTATFVSEVRPDIMRWKYRKLVRNLRNGIEAICGREASRGRIGELTTAEAEQVLEVAGIDVAPLAEDEARRGNILQTGPVGGAARPGGSVWQSLTRQVGTIETDYLSGEIVLLGHLHGVETPVNALLQRLATYMASNGRPPATVTESEFMSMLDA